MVIGLRNTRTARRRMRTRGDRSSLHYYILRCTDWYHYMSLYCSYTYSTRSCYRHASRQSVSQRQAAASVVSSISGPHRRHRWRGTTPLGQFGPKGRHYRRCARTCCCKSGASYPYGPHEQSCLTSKLICKSKVRSALGVKSDLTCWSGDCICMHLNLSCH